MRSSERIAPQVSECPGRNAEGANVEPARGRVNGVSGEPALRDCLLASRIGVRGDRAGYKGIGDEVRPQVIAWGPPRRAASQVGQVSRDLQVVGLSRPRLKDVVRLPVAQNPGRRTAP